MHIIFSFLFFLGLELLRAGAKDGLLWFLLGVGGEFLIILLRLGPELLILELLLRCGVVCMVVGGPEACFRLLLPWGGGVTWTGTGDFSVALLVLVVESAEETVISAAISFCNKSLID